MSEEHKYIAVTIGPIFDTINIASSPSALWAASYMFSMLSKNLCKVLTENGILSSDIVTPYFDEKDENFNRNDGVGLYHDRIIFRADCFEISSFNAVKDEAIKRTIKLFGFGENQIQYFTDYFLISAVSFTAENPILESSKMLDCLELSKSFVSSQERNPILTLYTSDREERKNENLRQCVRNMGIYNWQLLDSNRTVLSIDKIASAQMSESKKLKKHDYYVIVRSDGDNISKIIQSLSDDKKEKNSSENIENSDESNTSKISQIQSSDENVRKFSRICLEYCAEIADKVHNEYGGVTIYSGGDDLLAIMPIENHNGKTIFDFAKDANDCFRKKFDEFNQDVSLSFGMFVCYKNFPLYEALEQSANLLFDVAKKSVKNCLAVVFQKHAGQSEGLLIPNNDLDRYIEFHKTCVSKIDDKAEKIVLSAMHKLAIFEKLFNNAEDDVTIKNLFENVFDADMQKSNTFLQETLCEFFIDLKKDMHILTISENGLDKENYDKTDDDKQDNENTEKKYSKNYARKMNYILRIIKFFTEKAGEKHENISG